jgi:hypothetical protein
MSIDSIVRHYINDSECEGALMINGKWGLEKSRQNGTFSILSASEVSSRFELL